MSSCSDSGGAWIFAADRATPAPNASRPVQEARSIPLGARRPAPARTRRPPQRRFVPRTAQQRVWRVRRTFRNSGRLLWVTPTPARARTSSRWTNARPCSGARSAGALGLKTSRKCRTRAGGSPGECALTASSVAQVAVDYLLTSRNPQPGRERTNGSQVGRADVREARVYSVRPGYSRCPIRCW